MEKKTADMREEKKYVGYDERTELSRTLEGRPCCRKLKEEENINTKVRLFLAVRESPKAFVVSSPNIL